MKKILIRETVNEIISEIDKRLNTLREMIKNEVADEYQLTAGISELNGLKKWITKEYQ